MTFTNITDLRNYILATFTANGVRDITGPEAQDAFIGILDLLAPTLTEELIVSVGAGQVGGAFNGDVLTQGEFIEAVLRKILREPVPPTYVLPVTTLNSSVTTLNNEIGTIISPTFDGLYTQNDGGVAVTRYLTKNGVNIATSSPYTDSSVVLDSTKTYQTFITYGQGACKNNSLGDQDCTHRIQPGTAASNLIIYNGYRKAFWGVPVVVVNSSATVRALSNGSLSPQVGSAFVINIPAGSQRVVFAYPATLQDPTSVKYKEFGNCEVKGIFTKTTVSVEGASGFTAIDYKVFTYEPIESFQIASTYEVTI